ncbi:MAG TPA: DUF1801 domain-containing protein [Trueperaceae bacterium]
MAAKDAVKTAPKRSADKRIQRGAGTGFTAEEKAAMRERAAELRAEARRDGKRADGEQDLLAKVAELPQPDRAMAERLHAAVMKAAPELEPRTWYGMPAWAKDGKVLCFLQPAAKFGTRYATFGFNDIARLDDGPMWPASYAVTELTPEVEERLAALVKRAVS